MTNKELKDFESAVKAFREKHAKTPKQARDVLMREGVIDKHGKLTEHYAKGAKLAKAS